MSPSGAEYIRQIKSQVEEVDPAQVSEHLGNGIVLVDVRESTEWDAGHIPGAKHVPRAYLESRIEGAAGADRSQEIVLYCASGQRSALAAHTLKEQLGYENVKSMTGGITLWKDRGYKVEVPKTPDGGPARALLAPPADPGDRARGPDQAAGVQGAAAGRRRARLADGALPRRRRRRHARRGRRRRRRPLQPAAPGHPHDGPDRRRRRSTRPSRRSPPSTRTSRSSSTRRGSTPPTSWRSSTATT